MAGGRSSNITNLRKAGVTFVFNEEAAKARSQQWPLIVTKVVEEKPVGIYMTAGDVGNATAHVEGSAIKFEGIDEAYKTELTTITYEKGVFATKRQMDDDQTNTVKGLVPKLINAMINTKEQVCADAYNDGFATTAADSVYVFSSTHPLTNAPGKYNDNLITGTLSTDGIKEAVTQFSLIKDMAGNRFPTKATHILVNSMEQFTLIELLQSVLMAKELSNTINSLNKSDSGVLGLIFNDYIDHTGKGDTYSPWFVLDKNVAKAGCIYQYRGGMKQDSEEDFKTKDWEITCLEDYVAGFVSPGFGIVASQSA
jgi:phage major head subunit gpT-like protein